jgi:hypothetical protein
MRTNVWIVLALALVTTASSGCCGPCRNWLRRGSLCGTTTAAPAVMGAPVALGTPYVQQPMAAPMQQVVMPQANCQCAPQCVPQCMPQCVPMCQPCCDPCASMCSPCGPSTWSGGYMDGGCCEGTTSGEVYDSGTVVPSNQQPSLPQTFVPQGTTPLTSPDPGPRTGVNYPESAKPSN